MLLFAGPLPFDLAVQAGAIQTPATFVPVSGWALPTAILKARELGIDPELLSIDSASRQDVEEVFDAVGLRHDAVRVLDYASNLGSDQFLEFHAAGEATGQGGAITSIPSVAAELRRRKVPHVLMSPSQQTISQALNTAHLLGAGSAAEESRLVLAIVRLPSSAGAEHATALSAYERQGMRIAVHRALLEVAQEAGSVVVVRDELSFFVFLTLGSLKRLSDDLSRAPFVNVIRDATGLRVQVGIGLADTVAEAEAHAMTAVARSGRSRGFAAALVWPTGEVALLPTSAESRDVSHDRGDEDPSKALLRELVEALRAANEVGRVVDAQRVSELMNVSLRSARRALRSLVEAGYAWPLPPDPADRAGRPPIPYQLLEEKLG
ncbi:hypothetical protein [Nocardioides endophyticus]|uniref:hypothetical protein n=1 Tax=Nocardioides endophyticus TaxID=1353775 RepID=UPI0031EC4729